MKIRRPILLLLAVGCVLFISTGSHSEMKQTRLTVLTYNIWHGLNPSSVFRFGEYETEQQRETRLQGFFEQVRQIKPDIIFLQEVNPAPGKSKRIAQELDYDYVYLIDNAGLKIGSLGIPTNLRSGLTTLTKKSLHLKKLGGRKLSGPRGGCTRALSLQTAEFRYVLAAEVTVNGQPVLLLNTHLHHGLELTPEIRDAIESLVAQGQVNRERADEVMAISRISPDRRRRELETAVAFAHELGMNNMPTIFAGDFNASPDASELAWLTNEIGFHSVTEDDDPNKLLLTWDPLNNPNTHFVADFVPAHEYEEFLFEHFQEMVVHMRRRLDYIFYRQSGNLLTVENAGLFGDQPYQGIMCSDHFGIYAVMQITP